jgi:hypothetical protein
VPHLFILPFSRPFDDYGAIRPVPYYALFYLRPYFLRPVTVFGRFFTALSVYGRCGALLLCEDRTIAEHHCITLGPCTLPNMV